MGISIFRELEEWAWILGDCVMEETWFLGNRIRDGIVGREDAVCIFACRKSHGDEFKDFASTEEVITKSFSLVNEFAHSAKDV